MIDTGDESNNELALVARLAVEAAADKRVIRRAASSKFYLAPEGMDWVELFGKPPEFINRKVTVSRPADFVVYVDQWATVNPARMPPELYLIPDTRTFLAILDPSCNRAMVCGTVGETLSFKDLPDPVGYEAHTCLLTMQIDRKLQKWKDFCGSPCTQEEVALFLEERFKDVVSTVGDRGEPTVTGIELKSVAREFRMVRKLSLGSVVDMTNGTFDLEFSKKDAPGEKSTVTFPEYIYLGLPVFKGSAHYQIKIRARYRLTEANGLQFIFDILDWDELVESALADTEQEIDEGLEACAKDSKVDYLTIMHLAGPIRPNLTGDEA